MLESTAEFDRKNTWKACLIGVVAVIIGSFFMDDVAKQKIVEAGPTMGAILFVVVAIMILLTIEVSK